MNKEAIFEKMVAIISAEKGKDVVISRETSLSESIADDSVEVMEFIITLEDEFGVEIPDEAIEGFETLGNIVDYIAKQK